MPRYHAITQSHITQRRRTRIKSVFFNSIQRFHDITENTVNVVDIASTSNLEAIIDNNDISTLGSSFINAHTFGKCNQLACNDEFVQARAVDSSEREEINMNNEHYSSFCNEGNSTLVSDLRQCFLEENISHSSANKILKLLNKHKVDENLPTDIRTLLGTPRSSILHNVLPGKYIHFGLKLCLEHSLNLHFKHRQVPEKICLNFNIDGLPISKSSCSQFWPILGSLAQVNFYTEPFVIGIYHGNMKPKSNNEFLEIFINEMKELLETGFVFENRHLTISIGAFICDAPARAYTISVKSHTGFNSCTKCTIHGEYYEHRVIFPEVDNKLRTDSSFALKEDEDHHRDSSELEKLNFGMVSHFPLDYMHLVCLGVMKKILMLLTRGNMSLRLNKEKIEKISSRLIGYKPCIPSEHARKPRSLDELERWKATEFMEYYGDSTIYYILFNQDQCY